MMTEERPTRRIAVARRLEHPAAPPRQPVHREEPRLPVEVLAPKIAAAVSLPRERETPLLPPAVGKRRSSPGLSIPEACRIALDGLRANKLRAFLTMLGIIIGVGAVIIMVALGQGVAGATQAAIAKLGTNMLTIIPQSQQQGGVKQGLGSAETLKLADADYLRQHCPSVSEVSAEYRGNATVKYANQNNRTTVQGGSPEYFDIHNVQLADGRFFTGADVRRRARVAVIGDNVRQELFGDEPAVGKTIKVNDQNFEVIGVAQPQGAVAFRNPDDQITVPVTTAMMRLFGVQYLNSISVEAASKDAMDEAQSEIYDAIAKAHRQRQGDQPDIRIFNQQDLMDSANQQSTFLTMLLAGIAFVSLVVGGIGIMNIMLVSVTERTREIGVRKAIGARRSDILYQFLIEAVTLALVGGIIGILFGVGTSLWMGLAKGSGGLGFPMQLSLPPILLSFGFSALVGVFFGIYPAMKASRLDPILALRHE